MPSGLFLGEIALIRCTDLCTCQYHQVIVSVYKIDFFSRSVLFLEVEESNPKFASHKGEKYCLSIHPSIHPSIHKSTLLFVHALIYLSDIL
jgi:hypothetical protein